MFRIRALLCVLYSAVGLWTLSRCEVLRFISGMESLCKIEGTALMSLYICLTRTHMQMLGIIDTWLEWQRTHRDTACLLLVFPYRLTCLYAPCWHFGCGWRWKIKIKAKTKSHKPTTDNFSLPTAIATTRRPRPQYRLYTLGTRSGKKIKELEAQFKVLWEK